MFTTCKVSLVSCRPKILARRRHKFMIILLESRERKVGRREVHIPIKQNKTVLGFSTLKNHKGNQSFRESQNKRV